MVFPFDDDPSVRDLGYELDPQAMRWMTVGDDLDDNIEDEDDAGISILTGKLAARLQLEKLDHKQQNTTEDPLIVELKAGRGWTAGDRILSGASLKSKDTGTGRTILQTAWRTLLWLQEQELTFAANDPPDYATTSVESRRLNRIIYRDIISLCLTHESINRHARSTARRNAHAHAHTRTRNQPQLHLHKSGTGTKTRISLLETRPTTRLSNASKTLAVLDRGPAFSHVRAVSGCSAGVHDSSDGCLDREFWFQTVLQLCQIIEHTLPRNARFAGQRGAGAGAGPGSYAACHAVKQVCAIWLWWHSTVFLDAEMGKDVQMEEVEV